MTDFHRDQAKKLLFFLKKNPEWPIQKNWVFLNRQFQKNFVKISWIGPWVRRIDWCKGHWCSSTYIVERLSDVSSKTGKKCIFCVFRLFLRLRWTTSQPYTLSYINALGINHCLNKHERPLHSERTSILQDKATLN